MNIFVLHWLPQIAALYHCDKHVVKMILEYAQILCNRLTSTIQLVFGFVNLSLTMIGSMNFFVNAVKNTLSVTKKFIKPSSV